LLAPEGASFPAMVKVAEQAEALLRQVPGIRLVLTSVGGGGFGGVNSARFYVRLAPHEERVFSFKRLLQWPPWRAWEGNYSQRDVMQQVRRVMRQLQDVRISVRNPQTFSIGGPNFDIDFALLGPDLNVLAEYTERLRLKAPELGLLDADTTLKLDKPELRVEINRDRAARLGVDTEHIAEALRIMVGGDERVSRFHDPTINEDYDVQVRLSEADRTNAATIARLFVPDAQGRLVRLDNVVQLETHATVSRVDRLDRQRQVSLRAQVAPGYAQADRIAALRELQHARFRPRA
jgi:HAE1 family hydrophobic/amphiphilic exporter-1